MLAKECNPELLDVWTQEHLPWFASCNLDSRHACWWCSKEDDTKEEAAGIQGQEESRKEDSNKEGEEKVKLVENLFVWSFV